jgi:protein SCO1/2
MVRRPQSNNGIAAPSTIPEQQAGIVAGGHHAMKQRLRILIVLAPVAAAVGALTTAAALRGVRSLPQTTTSGVAAIGGPFALVATNGATVTEQDYRSKWLLIFFGYTFCPDACPTALNNISVALEKLGPEADRLQPLFVTVDPERDTREVMSDYLKSFDSRIVGLTGFLDQIDNVVREYRVYVARQKSESEGDNCLVWHSAYIYLMDPQGKFVNVIQGSAAGDDIAA